MHLAALQFVKLYYVSFHPPALARMVQLQHLLLHNCTLLGAAGDGTGAAGVAALLSVLGHLQQLRNLNMAFRFDFEDMRIPMPAEQFSTLTASSHLTHLALSSTHGRVLPRGAVHHMFPPGKELPHMQVVAIQNCPSNPISTAFYESGWCIAATELRSIFTACTALTNLDISGSLEPGNLMPLLLLPPSCKDLFVDGLAFMDDAAASTLVKLTHLTKLTWWYPIDLTDTGLEQLTALRGLQELLVIRPHGLSECLAPRDDEDGSVVVDIELYSSEEPVWQQLLNMCEEGWSAERWKSMLTEQQQDNQALKDTIAELQRHNEELQRHNKELLLRLDQLEQQQQQPSRNT